jgi:hypothetical protein
MAKKHGPPLGVSKEKTFKDIKSTNYRNNCKTGYKGPKNNAHHVVPCISLRASLTDYLDGKEPEYRKALAFFTNWDVNAGTNLLGLPVQESYQLVFKSMDRRGIDVGRPKWIKPPWRHMTTPKYPIHIPAGRWGHTDYNDLVETDLTAIWTKLEVKHEKHEPTEATDLGSEIQRVSRAFRAKLQAKVGQTIEDWKAGNFAQFMMV